MKSSDVPKDLLNIFYSETPMSLKNFFANNPGIVWGKDTPVDKNGKSVLSYINNSKMLKVCLEHYPELEVDEFSYIRESALNAIFDSKKGRHIIPGLEMLTMIEFDGFLQSEFNDLMYKIFSPTEGLGRYYSTLLPSKVLIENQAKLLPNIEELDLNPCYEEWFTGMIGITPPALSNLQSNLGLMIELSEGSHPAKKEMITDFVEFLQGAAPELFDIA